MDEMMEIIGQSRLVFRRIDSAESLLEVFRLRYEVYCHECNFLKPEEYPEGVERDKYDPYSVQFSASDQYGIVGTVRLVMDSPHGFPFEKYCRGKLNIDMNAVPRKQAAEISRLVISKRFRNRGADGLYYTPDFDDGVTTLDLQGISRRVRPMAFGLYREMYQESKRRGITHWFALMEKSLYLLLRLHGFTFKPIGEDVDVYGMVTPYLAEVEDIEKSLYQKSPEFARAYFATGLELKYRPQFLT